MVDLFQYRHWAISESYFRDVAPRIAKLLAAGHSIDSLIKKNTVAQLTPRLRSLLEIKDESSSGPLSIAVDGSSGLPVVNQNNKNIALIPVVGGLTKYGNMCSYGMQEYQGMIASANASPNIDGIVLIMDSPGGTVDGTQEFGMSVRNSLKPVGVFGDHQVASAALWIASQASVIIGNKNNHTLFGSIGTLMITENWSKMMEAGREPIIEIIRAPQSTDKALINPVESISEKARKELSDELRGITNDFINAVKSGRGDKLNSSLEGLFSGKMFDVNTAKQNGLIDGVGTLQTTVNKVAELARQQAKEEGTKSNANNNSMKLPKLSALLGAAKSLFLGEPGTKEVSLSAEQAASLEASEQKLGEMEAENAQLKVSITAKDQASAALTTKVAELEATITSLGTEKAALIADKAALQKKVDEKPAGEKTTVISAEGKENSKFRSQADEESDEYLNATMFKNEKQTQK